MTSRDMIQYLEKSYDPNESINSEMAATNIKELWIGVMGEKSRKK